MARKKDIPPTSSWEEEYDRAVEDGIREQAAAPTEEYIPANVPDDKRDKRELSVGKAAAKGRVEGVDPAFETPTSGGAQRTLLERNGLGADGQGRKPSDEMQDRMTMAGMAEELKKNFGIESDEQRKIREKRERRERLFASIGDGIGALSDIYFSTKGAPIVHEPSSQSEKMRKRHEELNAERKANRMAYNQAYIRQLEQMRKEARQKRIDEQSAIDAEFKRQEIQSRIEANRALANYRSTLGENSSNRTDAYIKGVENRNQNNDKRTDAYGRNVESQVEYRKGRLAQGSSVRNKKKKTGGNGNYVNKPLGVNPLGV